MLKFFNHTPPEPAKPAGTPPPHARQAASASGPAVPEAPPLPEVSEGNQDSDWAMWEDSVAFQDSQMPSEYGELNSVKERGKDSRNEDLDPFSTVRRRGS